MEASPKRPDEDSAVVNLLLFTAFIIIIFVTFMALINWAV